MPRRSKGPRLWLALARRDASGKITHYPTWVIRDGSRKISTGCGDGELGKPPEAAQQALAKYILTKTAAPRERSRDPSQCRISEVIRIYSDDVVGKHAEPGKTAARLKCIVRYFGPDETLAALNARSCAAYVQHRGHVQMARRELEDLRAAVNYHWKQGLCSTPVPVVLPEKSMPRERWLTRSEAARLLWAAWRMKRRAFPPKFQQEEDGTLVRHYPPLIPRKKETFLTGQHVARFILVGLYTGTRSGAIIRAALQPTEGRGFVDLERGVFYRRPAGRRETKKRQPPIRIPPCLLAHLRRWARLGIIKNFVVEYQGKPVTKVYSAWGTARKGAGLGRDVVPHTLRHTCATWMMQAGVDLWEAAGFLGMTVEMLQERYGHHHPDYQSGAVNALSGRRAKKAEASNVVKLTG